MISLLAFPRIVAADELAVRRNWSQIKMREGLRRIRWSRMPSSILTYSSAFALGSPRTQRWSWKIAQSYDGVTHVKAENIRPLLCADPTGTSEPRFQL